MSRDPFQDVLGVPADAGPLELLGLDPDAADTFPLRIEEALRARLAAVFEASGISRADAARIRRRLRKAAREIRSGRRPAVAAAGAPEPEGDPVGDGRRRSGARRRRARVAPPGPPQELTEFDRRILAILVGCGGWNAASRARLVALAASWGVTVAGLLRVIGGLGEYARGGGLKAARGARRVESRPQEPLKPAAEPEVLERIASEFHPRDSWTTVKLALGFGVLTLLFVMLAVRFLFFPGDFKRTAAPSPVAAAPPVPAAGASPEPEPHPGSLAVERAARFASPPSFLGHAQSAEVIGAIDGCGAVAQDLRTLARRITLADEPSEAVYRAFAAAADTVATAWGFVERRLLQEIDEAVLDAVYAASGSPSMSDRILSALAPSTGRLTDPAALWRGSWKAGMLGRIAAEPGLSPAVTQRARTLLEIVLGPAAAPQGFDTAAERWLDGVLDQMIELTEIDGRRYDFWETWLSLRRRLGRGERFEATLMDALEALLRTSTDLSRPGPSLDVVGRLVSTADFRASPVVRERVLRLFAEVEGVSSHDLWVLTSLLAQETAAPWFGPDLVLPDGADWMYRRRTADRIAERWPEAATAPGESLAQRQGIAVDRDAGSWWMELHRLQAQSPLAADPQALLQQLVAAARLNEAAAHLAAGDPAAAREALGAVADGGRAGAVPADRARSRRPQAPPPVGRPIGADGVWAASYQEAGNSTDARLEWLRGLGAGAGTDLGPVDAEVFVGVVYRGAPSDVRTLAQEVLLGQFGSGPNVALRMLDQLPDAPISPPTAATIETYTGAVLPAPGAESWPAGARLALARHALHLRTLGERGIDLIAEELIDVYARQLSALTAGRGSPAAPVTPGEAVERLVEAWRFLAESHRYAAAPDQDLALLDLRGATRLRLARGPLQEFVAGQLQVLDLLAFVAAAEQPAAASDLRALMSQDAQERGRLSHVLEQAVAVERTTAKVWARRIVVEGGQG
jgi:hypothetical protein